MAGVVPDAPSKQARRIERVLRLVRFRALVDLIPASALGVQIARFLINVVTRLGGRPRGIWAEPVQTHNEGHEVLGEWVRPPGVGNDGAAILYLHGSGYVLASPKTYRAMVGRLSRLTGLPVFVPAYRLAPEHPFPAAADDTLAAYRWLQKQGFSPDRIVVAGDSAGGHLAIGLAAASCREHELEPPAGLVLISPLVDHTFTVAEARKSEREDPLFSAALARRLVALSTTAGEASDPRLALLDGDGKDLPPILLQAGGLELLRADAELFAELVNGAGGSCELQIWPGQIHVFQILLDRVPEANAALRDVARFVRSVTQPAAVDQPAADSS